MSSKDKVLQFLSENDSAFTSGQKIADLLGLSRNSVWKAVKQLKDDGYKIEAVTNRGYRLSGKRDILSEDEIRKNLVSFPSIPIFYYPEIDSTNKKARELANSGAQEGTLVVADSQSAGRGRLGRSFYSPKGVGIYFSLIIRPHELSDCAPFITTAAAVAVAKAVREKCGKDARIKWVNDVYIDGKKICGILTEAVTDMESGTIESAVIGIGINFYNGSFPEELRDIAAPIFTERSSVTRSEFTAAVTDELLSIITNLPDRSFMQTYRSLSLVIDKDVVCRRGNTTFEGHVLDVDDMGGLILNVNGKIETLRSGEITLRLK